MARHPTLDFEGLKQVFRFEVSRFPFLPEERQRRLRKTYRELEATLRNAVRELEFSWGNTRFVSPRIMGTRLEKIHQSLAEARGEHDHHLSAEMRSSLEQLCGHVRALREYVSHSEATFEAPIEELCDGLEELKRTLGTVHRL